MIYGRVGEAQKDFTVHSIFKFIVPKQIRQEAIGIISPDRAKNHLNIRISESLQQIRRPVFRMIFHIFDSLKRMGHKPDLQAKIFQPLYAYFQFMLSKWLSDRSS